MNNKYLYLAGAVIIIIIIFLVGNRDKEVENITETSTTTDSTLNTSTNSKPSVVSPTPTPKPTTQTEVSPTATTPKPTETTPTGASIQGSIFRLKSYNGATVPNGSKYTLYFDGESLSAKFCNNIQGVYVLDGNKLSVANLVGTKMYCSEPANLMAIEDSFSSILGFGVIISQVGTDLIITDSKNTVFVFGGFPN